MRELVKAAPNTAQYPMNGMAIEVEKEWIKGAAGARALLQTNNTYTGWLQSQFWKWRTDYDAGIGDEPPPAVPYGYDAEMTEDGWGYNLVSSGTPSGPTPTYTKRKVVPSSGGFGALLHPGTGHSGLLFGEVGTVVTQIDGTQWKRVG